MAGIHYPACNNASSARAALPLFWALGQVGQKGTLGLGLLSLGLGPRLLATVSSGRRWSCRSQESEGKPGLSLLPASSDPRRMRQYSARLSSVLQARL